MWELLQILFSDVISQKTFICSKSTIETLEKVIKQKRQNDYWNRYGDFIGDFELIYIFLVFFFAEFEQVRVCQDFPAVLRSWKFWPYICRKSNNFVPTLDTQ